MAVPWQTVPLARCGASVLHGTGQRIRTRFPAVTSLPAGTWLQDVRHSRGAEVQPSREQLCSTGDVQLRPDVGQSKTSTELPGLEEHLGRGVYQVQLSHRHTNHMLGSDTGSSEVCLVTGAGH